jgi:hypothetical protein
MADYVVVLQRADGKQKRLLVDARTGQDAAYRAIKAMRHEDASPMRWYAMFADAVAAR